MNHPEGKQNHLNDRLSSSQKQQIKSEWAFEEAFKSMTSELQNKFGKDAVDIVHLSQNETIISSTLTKHDIPFESIYSTNTNKPSSFSIHGKRWTVFMIQNQYYCIAWKEAISDINEQLELLRRETLTLKRIGNALNKNHTPRPLGLAVVHAIKGALALHSVSIYLNSESGAEYLLAYTGEDDPQTKAKPASYTIYADNHPIGRLELEPFADDKYFSRSSEIHQTISEHLSFALVAAQSFETIEKHATTDPLTGIANHRMLQDFLAESVGFAKESSGKLSVVMVDVDHFRHFNETEGHDAGDHVLTLVAQSLESTIGDNGLAARYGGEEFTLVLPSVSDAQAKQIAEKCLSSISKTPYISKSGKRKTITASFGIASFPSGGLTPTELLKNADKALYQAKANGRNRVELHSPKPKAA